MSWLEVESKIKISKKDLPLIRKRIKEIARFSGVETKKDQYYSLENAFYPRKAFRIRSNGKEDIVNFNKRTTKIMNLKSLKKFMKKNFGIEIEDYDLKYIFDEINNIKFFRKYN